MTIRIYHNPRCSKSRKTLQLIEEAGVEPDIVLYLEDVPSADDIVVAAARLGLPVADLLRRGESAFREARDLPVLEDDAALASWLTRNPIVLQRPIVFDTKSGRAVIGRPPENVAELLR